MAEETDHMAMDLDIQEDLISEICIPTHNKLQGKDSSLKIFSIFEVLQACVRVKVSWFRTNGVDKTNSDDREERNRASRGGGEGEGGRKNTLELPRPYLELDHMLLYCLYDTKKVMTVEDVTAQTWQQKVVNSEIPMVVNFSAVRCGFCRALEPLYNRLSEQYSGKLDFLKLMVDDPKNNEVLHRASVEGTPTLKFYCRAREVGEHIGYAIEPVLKQKIDSILAEMESCLDNSTPIEKEVQAKY